MNKKFKYYILVGFFSILPIGATIWVLKWLLTLLVGPAQSITKVLLPSTILQPYASWVFGFILTITFVFIFGYIVSSFLGRLLFSKIENLIEQIPIANTLYKTIKSVIDSISNSQHNAFQKVVMLEYPRKGIWVVGFATKENTGIIKNKINEDLVNIFVPTTPNPTSGFLLMLPKKDLIYLDVSFEQASKFIVSAGTTNID